MNGDFDPSNAENWSEGFDGANVRADIYPGNLAHMGDIQYGEWAIIAENHTQEEIDAALAFLSFMYQPEWLEARLIEFGGIAPYYEPSEEFHTALADSPLLIQQQDVVNSQTRYWNAVWNIMSMSMESAFSNLLTQIATNTITPEQFAEQMTIEALASVE